MKPVTITADEIRSYVAKMDAKHGKYLCTSGTCGKNTPSPLLLCRRCEKKLRTRPLYWHSYFYLRTYSSGQGLVQVHEHLLGDVMVGVCEATTMALDDGNHVRVARFTAWRPTGFFERSRYCDAAREELARAVPVDARPTRLRLSQRKDPA